METQSFYDYLAAHYRSKKSGTVSSYKKALIIIDELFHSNDVFDLNGKPLHELKDPSLIARIVEYIDAEEWKYRKNQPSFFDDGRPSQTSYPSKRYCTGAIHQLRNYINEISKHESLALMSKYRDKGAELSKELIEKFRLNEEKTETEAIVKQRIGQGIFRAMLLNIYYGKCCLTGLDVPEVLRASHIIPWADKKETRMNPENGLCLSAIRIPDEVRSVIPVISVHSVDGFMAQS